MFLLNWHIQSFLTFCTLASIGLTHLGKHGAVLGSIVEDTALSVCGKEIKWIGLYISIGRA